MFARTQILGAALAALTLVTAPAALAQSTGNRLPRGAIERAVIREMNAFRADRDREPLRGSAALTRAARGHSHYMARTGDFRHESANGNPFWQRLVNAGFPRNRRMAENIAMVPSCGATAAAWVVRLWINSPPHRRNLLDPKLSLTGVGVAIRGDCEAVYVTADYGG